MYRPSIKVLIELLDYVRVSYSHLECFVYCIHCRYFFFTDINDKIYMTSICIAEIEKREWLIVPIKGGNYLIKGKM